MAWDLERERWADDLLSELRLSPALLSRPVPTGTVVGTLDRSLARALGLGDRVALVTGAHDQAAGAVGAGVLADGDAVISTGTAEVLSTTFILGRRRPPSTKGSTRAMPRPWPGGASPLRSTMWAGCFFGGTGTRGPPLR